MCLGLLQIVCVVLPLSGDGTKERGNGLMGGLYTVIYAFDIDPSPLSPSMAVYKVSIITYFS